jgi:hypothetical protein
MWGAAEDPRSQVPLVDGPVDVALVRDASGTPWLELRPDPAFFDRPGLTYPVTIDPSTDLAGTLDTYVRSDAPDSSFGADPELHVGTPGTGVRRSLLRFTWNIAALTDGSEIKSDTWLDLYETVAYDCVHPLAVELWNAGTSGTMSNSSTWNNAPGPITKYASTTDVRGTGCTGGPGFIRLQTGGQSGYTVGKMVHNWTHGGSENGIIIKAASETSTSGWRKFSSAQGPSSQHWIMHVGYDHYPAAPGAIAPAAGGIVTGPSVTLSASYSDPDPSDAGNAIFIVRNASGQVVDANGAPTSAVSTVTGSTVDSVNGAPPSGTSAATVSLPGGTYTLTVKNTDNQQLWDGTTAASALSASRSFTVRTPPATPTGLTPADSTGTLSTTPTFSAAYSSPDARTGHIRVVVSMVQTTGAQSLVSPSNGWTASSVASGQTSTFTATAPLPEGIYTWYAYAEDTVGLTSPPSAAQTIFIGPHLAMLPLIDDGVTDAATETAPTSSGGMWTYAFPSGVTAALPQAGGLAASVTAAGIGTGYILSSAPGTPSPIAPGLVGLPTIGNVTAYYRAAHQGLMGPSGVVEYFVISAGTYDNTFTLTGDGGSTPAVTDDGGVNVSAPNGPVLASV